MLERICQSIARSFVQGGAADPQDEDVYAYGLELLLSSILEVAAVLLISIFGGGFLSTLAFFAAFIPLRTYAGGFHASTHLRCFLTLLAVYGIYTGVSVFCGVRFFPILSAALSAASVPVIFLLAPVASSEKPLTSAESRRYRRRSIRMVLLASALVAALLWTAKTASLALGLAFGQLASAGSLVAAEILTKRKGGHNENVEVGNSSE